MGVCCGCSCCVEAGKRRPPPKWGPSLGSVPDVALRVRESRSRCEEMSLTDLERGETRPSWPRPVERAEGTGSRYLHHERADCGLVLLVLLLDVVGRWGQPLSRSRLLPPPRPISRLHCLRAFADDGRSSLSSSSSSSIMNGNSWSRLMEPAARGEVVADHPWAHQVACRTPCATQLGPATSAMVWMVGRSTANTHATACSAHGGRGKHQLST